MGSGSDTSRRRCRHREMLALSAARTTHSAGPGCLLTDRHDVQARAKGLVNKILCHVPVADVHQDGEQARILPWEARPASAGPPRAEWRRSTRPIRLGGPGTTHSRLPDGPTAMSIAREPIRRRHPARCRARAKWLAVSPARRSRGRIPWLATGGRRRPGSTPSPGQLGRRAVASPGRAARR